MSLGYWLDRLACVDRWRYEYRKGGWSILCTYGEAHHAAKHWTDLCSGTIRYEPATPHETQRVVEVRPELVTNPAPMQPRPTTAQSTEEAK